MADTLEIDTTTHRSDAHTERPAGDNPPNAIIFHSGEGDRDDDIHVLTHTGTSAHYYVTRKGTIFQFVDDDRRAHHSGPCHYLNRTDWDDFSLGVETEHKHPQNWPLVQLGAITALFKHLIRKHGILRERVVAHRWVREPHPDHRDPTGFTDAELRAFIAGLYPDASRGTLMKVTTDDSNVRRHPDIGEPPVGRLNAGDVIEIDDEVQGEDVHGNSRWMKRVKSQGFVHSSLLRPVEIAND